MYEYAATVLKVVDGDTVHLEVDLGLDQSRKLSARLYGINAPELNTAAGKAARQHLTFLLFGGDGPRVTVRTYKDRREKYGRYLGTLVKAGVDVNHQMVEDGHAVVYRY